jgi:hypothetical protein
MLAILKDESADQRRRDDMAKAAAPYIHPRLTAVEVSANHVGGGGNVGGGDVNIVQIYAVPRGARFAADGTVTIDGAVLSELPSVEPFTPTPALTNQTELAAPVEPLPVIELDTSNVTMLRRRSDDDEPGPGAA